WTTCRCRRTTAASPGRRDPAPCRSGGSRELLPDLLAPPTAAHATLQSRCHPGAQRGICCLLGEIPCCARDDSVGVPDFGPRPASESFAAPAAPTSVAVPPGLAVPCASSGCGCRDRGHACHVAGRDVQVRGDAEQAAAAGADDVLARQGVEYGVKPLQRRTQC